MKGGKTPMENKEIITWQDQKASERFRMISPLLDDGLDPAKRSQLRTRIAESNDVSERTLYRLEAAWRKDGFKGLRPMNRTMRRSQKLPANFDAIVGQAIHLKKEVPTRSVARIILILELEGWVAPGVLKRSTLQLPLQGGAWRQADEALYRGKERHFQTLLQAAPHDAHSMRYQVRSETSHR